ncbi:MAG: helix-turn-helix domain containing protein, partial [Gammaproteobacteria bacterium]|nr:helix-turn-helix domain containing protein [Gammaproteobacteria bacterium]
MNAQYPLRERRKRQTRMALIDAAFDLFSEKGYEDTTLEQIADHAGLHVQTLYRHFPSKPHLATAADQDRLDEFIEAIQNPQRSSTTFEFWREQIQLSVHRLREQNEGLDRYRQLIAHTSAVSTRTLAIGYEYERLLTESLAA